MGMPKGPKKKGGGDKFLKVHGGGNFGNFGHDDEEVATDDGGGKKKGGGDKFLKVPVGGRFGNFGHDDEEVATDDGGGNNLGDDDDDVDNFDADGKKIIIKGKKGVTKQSV